ncbi:MAG: hypothetical protein GDA51_08850 [Ekhidna sp.]|nr:hypothetical protein [Ekhidna sp.]MBC6426555.1 hypothetical protein [Ekhidna sp.]
MRNERSFYLFFVITACISTLFFGGYYLNAGIPELYIPIFSAFALFAIYGVLCFLRFVSLLWLFRISITTTLAAIFHQIYFTGGIQSHALVGLVTPTLLAFFYKPVSDRHIFMVVSVACLISMFPLSNTGYARNLLPSDSMSVHALMCAIFIFAMISIYTLLFRRALIVKNKELGKSMNELKKTTQKLVQSEKMASLGVLSAGVAHEINNPLNFIQNGVEALSKKIREDHKDKEKELEPLFKIVKEGINRATKIVKSLSHFSRKVPGMNEQCNIKDIIENCLLILRNKIKHKVKVITDFSSPDQKVKGNEGRLHQAVMNIIVNAEQAIKSRGTIKISTIRKGDFLDIIIEDDGEGIPKENISKINDPFFTTKAPGEGTGLGLFITYSIIHEHNGRIDVISSVGLGTTFTISLPI